MTSLVIAIPVLGRPHRAAAVAASARASVETVGSLRVLFLCSPGDHAEIAAARATGEDVRVVPWEAGRGDWAKKNNLAYAEMDEEWLFLGADDLIFHPGWFDACLRVWERTYACVIGTNDLGNARVLAGHHSTHTLVHRDYLDCGGVVDDPSRLLCELYGHNFVDDEFCQTAMARDSYAHAHNALVEHLHPNWAKSEDDETYRKGMARFADDQRLHARRRAMFGPRQRRRV